jgi:hypothetical protein
MALACWKRRRLRANNFIRFFFLGESNLARESNLQIPKMKMNYYHQLNGIVWEKRTWPSAPIKRLRLTEEHVFSDRNSWFFFSKAPKERRERWRWYRTMTEKKGEEESSRESRIGWLSSPAESKLSLHQPHHRHHHHHLSMITTTVHT